LSGITSLPNKGFKKEEDYALKDMEGKGPAISTPAIPQTPYDVKPISAASLLRSPLVRTE
jgi:hypothetical protein